MASLEFSLKVISPMFIGGSDITTDVEGQNKIDRIQISSEGIRVPSLKGVLRFWYRSTLTNMSIKEIKARESKIFGSTEHGQGVRIIPLGSANYNDESIITLSYNSRSFNEKGMGYLGYGPLLYDRDSRSFTTLHSNPKSLRRDAIKPGVSFDFKAIGNTEQLQGLEKSLILLHLFGGLGSRSRRGWGSVSVEFKSSNNFQPQLPALSYPIENWVNEVMEMLKLHQLASAINRHTSFSKDKIYRVGSERGKFEDVMNVFYRAFQSTRIWSMDKAVPSPPLAMSDKSIEVRHAGSDIDADIPKRLFYGLPFSPKGQHFKIEYQGSTNVNDPKKSIDRRASPLFLKVFEAEKGKLFPICLFLPATFFGDPNAKFIKKGGRRTVNVVEDWEAINDFLNKIN